MFVNGPSPIALLHAAVSECRLQYASLITEIADDPMVLCGVELELPQLELIGPCHEIFFWEATYLDPTIAYEKACLRAVSFLQLFYNLKITNYYSNGHYYSNGIPPHAFHIKSLSVLLDPYCEIETYAMDKKTGICTVEGIALSINSIRTTGFLSYPRRSGYETVTHTFLLP